VTGVTRFQFQQRVHEDPFLGPDHSPSNRL
jgi:hypothetical protein